VKLISKVQRMGSQLPIKILLTPQQVASAPPERRDLVRLRVNGVSRRTWVFSKLARGKSGLTLRNDNGAVLLAQITAQLDKGTFDIIGILSPSVINEDLRERLCFLAGLVKKRVIVINRPVLEKMLAHFEEQTKFEKKDPHKVYSASRSKRAKGRSVEAAGPFS
jgi:hypothetical protein